MHLLIIYGVSWLVAGVLALTAEVSRLHSTRALPAWLDLTGAVSLSWFAAPFALLLAPFLLLRGRRRV